LSLPIANSTQKAAQADEKEPPTKPTNRRSAAENAMKIDEAQFNFGLAGPTPAVSPMMSAASFSTSAPIPIPAAINSNAWSMPGVHRTQSLDDALGFKRSSKPAPLQRAVSYSPNSYDDALFSAPSTASMSNFSESEYPSPHELPPTPPEISCNEPLINGNIFLNCGESLDLGHAFSVDVSPSLTFTDGHLNFNMDSLDAHCLNDMYSSSSMNNISASSPTFDDMGNMVSLASPSFSNSSTPTLNGNERHTPVASNVSNSGIGASAGPTGWQNSTPVSAPSPAPPAIPQGIPPGPGLSNLSPRTAYLVEYYSNSICPVLVAVDGSNNPYRVHILALASASGPALVNAVAALASNVLHLRNNKHSAARGTSEEAMRYKAASVNLYNAALRDPAAAYDDSILATLVVLTLLEISENGGVANVKSQMGDIRQILTLRGSNSSQFLHWATMFFTWLDVMKATVVDRERQVRNGVLDLLDFSANLGALEHLSFCEGRMFKVLARMGSGTRTRRASSVVYSSTPTWNHSNAGFAVQEPRSRRPSINPFTGLPLASPMSASPIVSSEVIPTVDSIAHSASVSASIAAASPSLRPASTADARQEFWSEWSHVRSRLRMWSSRDPFASGSTGSSTPLMTSSHLASNTSGPEPSESALVTHASEVFRHAALLFSERLAFPQISSRSGQIQALVSSALHHLSSIPLTDSNGSPGLNKVLLWALCVIGTECVRPGDRDVIRLRCGDGMREPGVFGGISGMEVLERIWAAEDAGMDLINSNSWEDVESGMPLLSSLGAQASRWKNAVVMGVSTPVSHSLSMNMNMSVSSSWGMGELAAFC
jgi:Fungal specific transcription factor domain